MAAEYGFVKPTGRICANPSKIALVREFELESATNAYSGRLVKSGTTAAEVSVNDTSDNSACMGWIGYEQSNMEDRPDTITTIWVVNKSVPVLSGPGMIIRTYLVGGSRNSVKPGNRLVAAATLGGVTKAFNQSAALAPAATHTGYWNHVAISLETLDKSAVTENTGAELWVMSLI